ncbi:hypothetical protein WBG78_04040 [Chryseolinea sp. T2]|uniref:hypothetical protein n=1 Tax=Chryseolinea sp. T2 TaxID=3129255 RepID=UPI00307867A3
MKKILYSLAAVLLLVVALAFTKISTMPDGFTTGSPEIKSISSLAFGPDGILFIGDSRNASVVALNTKDVSKAQVKAVDLKNVDQKIAATLGTTSENIVITDMAVNPISGKIYFSVQTTAGDPALLTVDGDKIEAVPLKDVSYSSIVLNSAPSEDKKDRRGQPLRLSSISDLTYSDGKVMVSGLSNEEFSSSFRTIPFPFGNKQDQSSLEIYHAAHGKYETTSPIKTFTTAEIKGKKYLIASYTCTPLVLFPLDELKPGMHVKGRTVAEMGSGNQPLDMITMSKNGKSYLVMANNNRPVFRVNFKNIEDFQGSLTTPVAENFATEGVPFVSMPLTNVLQLDKLDDSRMVMLQRRADGSLDLWSSDKQEWLLQ